MNMLTRSAPGRTWLALLALLLPSVTASCAFFDDVPPGASILCRSDADCPTGTSCNGRHECAGDGPAPTIQEAFFEPTVTNGGVAVLVIRTDLPLTDEAPRLLWAPGSPELPMTFEATSATEHRLLVAVDDVEDGTYTVASVEAIGVDGQSSARTVHASLTVDRQAPVLRNARILHPPADGIWADRAPFDVVTVAFSPNEPLAVGGAILRLGGLTSTGDACATGESAAGEVVCSSSVVGLPDGPVAPTVVARDEAGNESQISLENIVVDAAPPGIVPGSIDVVIRAGSREVDEAGPGTSVSVSFLTTEELGPPPQVTLDVLGVAFVVQSAASRSVSVMLPAGTVVPEGSYRLRADLVDRFDHAAAIEIPLPNPYTNGIPFVPQGTVCPPPPGQLCIDGDGDGFPAVGNCPEGVDADDLDFLTRPAAIERPGDGVDNSQGGGDLPIDEAVGVFADSEAGDDAAAGTRAAPQRTLGAAVQRALASRRGYVFLAARSTAYDVGNGGVTTHVVGGLSPLTWERTTATSALGAPVVVSGNKILDHISSDFEVNLGSGLLVDSAVASSVNGVLVRSSTGSARGGDLVESAAASMFVSDSGGTVHQVKLLRSLVFGAVELMRRTGITVVDSAIQGGLVTSDGAEFVVLHHAVVRSSTSAVNGSFGSVTAIASILSAGGAEAAITVGPNTSLRLVGNDLVTAGADVVDIASGPSYTSDDLSSCLDTVCTEVVGNVAVDPAFISLAHVAATSAVRHASVNATEHGAPTSVALDIDFDCRYVDSGPDIGADEIR